MACVTCGKPTRFDFSKRCQNCYRQKLKSQTRENNPKWKGGVRKHDKGYILILRREHPNASSQGFVYQHRLVMEEKIGRYLLPSEVVHHLNGVKGDNRPENLELIADNIEHTNEKHNWIERYAGKNFPKTKDKYGRWIRVGQKLPPRKTHKRDKGTGRFV